MQTNHGLYPDFLDKIAVNPLPATIDGTNVVGDILYKLEIPQKPNYYSK